MIAPTDWTRRRFLAGAAGSAATLASGAWRQAFAFTAADHPPSPPPPAHLVPGTLRPLLEGNTARPLRYIPENGAFSIRNGREFFNRPLYGPGTAFRVDAGDLPEFSLYLPGHGGNLRVGISTGAGAKWLFEAEDIAARYLAGQMLYSIRDPLLAGGNIELHLATEAHGAGLHLVVTAHNTPADTLLTWAFGGVSGRKGRRGGDIGCELEPISRFFQLQPSNCTKNSYNLRAASAELKSDVATLQLTFPPGSRLHVAEAARWNDGWAALAQASEDAPQPILVGSVPLDPAGTPMQLLIRQSIEDSASTSSPAKDPAATLDLRLKQLTAISGNLRITSPDPYLDAAATALTHAAEAIWDEGQHCVLHGAVASRTALAGWRGPYALDALGAHARMREHIRYWIARQNQTPLPASQDPDAPVTGDPDANTHLTRKQSLLHTCGDLSANSHDMNLVFFDALVRHLRWTGDVELAREVWPALVRHMDWEYRTFRRTFRNPDPRAPIDRNALPLYEAYASTWAGDELQYNGAGVTHATAYNLFLNRSAAILARILNEDPAPYEQEADLIADAMHQLLWMPEAGAFAESRDTLLPQSAHTSPALATAYHAIDSEAASPRQAWQIVTDRLTALRRIPVHGAGVPEGPWYLLPSSDWLPSSSWHNSLALAGNMHFALALWQAGLPDDAYALLKGNLLDSMYQGLCPGNFHLSSQLDPQRGETQRDFADPIGTTSRAIVEGLFGVVPDLLRATLTIRPGFPSGWNDATLHHPDIDLAWRRDGLSESFEITSRLAHPVSLTLILPARTTSDPLVLSNGLAYPFAFDPDATGAPRLILTNFPAATAWKIEVRWQGKAPLAPPPPITCHAGDPIALPATLMAAQPDAVSRIDDPQACLRSGVATTPGAHSLFVPIHQGSCRYWLPIALTILPAHTYSVDIRVNQTGEGFEPIDLTPLLRNNITDVLGREYTSPRSPFCSLALPDHLVGAAPSFDPTITIDDSGLRSAGGTLHCASGRANMQAEIPFLTPADAKTPNCRLLSFWKPDTQRIELSLSGQARTLYLLMTGTTFPQASRTVHGVATVLYTDGTTATLTLRAPDTWWPIEQDYLFDDYLFRSSGPLPPRIDLRTGKTRLLDLATSKGQGGLVPGGAATLLHLPLDPDRTLASLQVECSLYGVVLGLVAATLGR